MTYTAKRLNTKTEGFIAGLLRSSPNLDLIGTTNPEELDDEVLLDLLVRYYVKVQYEEEPSSCGALPDEFLADTQRNLQGCPLCGDNNVPFESEEIAEEHHKRCAAQDYLVMLGIRKGHLCVFTVPEDTEAADELKCESVRFHLCDPTYKSVDKRNYSHFAEGATFPIDTFKFGELIQAYEDFDPPPSAADAFDVFSNNCATIAIEMLCSLGVNINEDMLNFVAERLTIDQDKIGALINTSTSLDKLREFTFPGDESSSSGEIASQIRKLVYSYNTTFNICSNQGAAAAATSSSHPKNYHAGWFATIAAYLSFSFII
mmetsp:Transcript_2637/g.4502  ORF Transcript_2637/g.4502 Transcript_2637/m.4502 type:complete len:317 (-) Transcript_2637:274-1224(-)